MATKASDTRGLRKVLKGIYELRSEVGVRHGIGLETKSQAPLVIVPIHLTSRRNAAALEQLLLENQLDPLMELVPIGALGRLLREIARSHPVIAVVLPTQRPSRALLLGLLAAKGYDFISRLSPRRQREVRQELREQHGFDTGADPRLPARYARTVPRLRAKGLLIHHGAPKSVRKRGLVFDARRTN